MPGTKLSILILFFRSSSGSESVTEPRPSPEAKGAAGVEGAKAASFAGSKLYYFDFSMIPDKVT